MILASSIATPTRYAMNQCLSCCEHHTSDTTMSLCTCQHRARCQWHLCDFHADWSVYQPRWWTRAARFRFMCDAHYQMYRDAMTKRIPGLEPDPRSSPEEIEEYRPSIRNMIRLAVGEAHRVDAAKAAALRISPHSKRTWLTPSELARRQQKQSRH
jgi:hypothetical protein